jgi:O-antigen ligase
VRPPRPSANFQPRPESAILQSFRGEVRATANLHPLENALLIIAGAMLCFMPWALGTMHEWSQFISLALAAVAMGVALTNRRYSGELAPQGDFRLIMWPKLIRFPLFWLGLLFLGYIFVQAVNPAWHFVRDGKYWWLEPVPHFSWLPTSVDAPYKEMNPWQMLVIYGATWLISCALWVGLTRRSAVQTLFTVIAANGALLAIVGILQRVTHARYILWVLNEVNWRGNFFATFIYKNHAGAYFNLVFMLSVGLLYWHFSRSERRLERTSPAPVFAFFSVLLGLSVLLSLSKAATILMMAFILVAFIGFIVRCSVSHGEGRSPWVITVLCAIFTLFIALGAYFLNTNEVFNRLGLLIEEGQTNGSVTSRNLARKATFEMAGDKVVTGWGAGSFCHTFPSYQKKHPEIYNLPGSPNRKMRWEYAHNDYVQLLAELGLIGAGLVLAMLICAVRYFFQQRIYLRPHIMFLVLALVITAAHAWVDFQFQNPAILILWCVSIILVGRWSEMENRRA